MPKNSNNLGLKLYSPTEDTTELSQDWFNDNFSYTNSNLTKIDTAVGKANNNITSLTSDLKQVKEDYLPLGGGTMIGDITLDGGAKIVGNLSGTASLATKAVQDGDGNVIATSYPRISAVAGYHNSVYRGKDITSKFTDGTLFANISNGTFEDLFIGDYFTATCNDISTKWRLAGFDMYYNCGDTALTRHHAVVIPDAILASANMNTSDTTTGGYVGSKMYKETIPDLATKIGAMVGIDHLIKYRDSLSNSVNTDAFSAAGGGHTGSVSGTTWTDVTIRLCSEVEVCGGMIWSSSARDAAISCMQLPLFSLNSALRIEENSNLWWLSSVSTNSGFCRMSNVGDTGFSTSSNVRGVRPLFLIG